MTLRRSIFLISAFYCSFSMAAKHNLSLRGRLDWHSREAEVAKSGEEAYSAFQADHSNVKAYGMLGEKTNYVFEYNLAADPNFDVVRNASDTVYQANISHMISDALTLTFGKQAVIWGGHEAQREVMHAFNYSTVGTRMAGRQYEFGLGLSYAVGDHTVSVQGINSDVQATGATPTQRNVGYGVHYKGSFNDMITPIASMVILPLGDNPDSSDYLTLGVRLDIDKLYAEVDMLTFETATTTAGVKVKTEETSLVVRAGYDMGKYTPWVKLAMDEAKTAGTTTSEVTRTVVGVDYRCKNTNLTWHAVYSMDDWDNKSTNVKYKDTNMYLGMKYDFNLM